MKTIQIRIGSQTFDANLYQTPTAEIIFNSLPLEGTTIVWGEEIYFTTPLEIEPEANAREILEIGELGFWTMGSAFCIFFGPTPASTTSKPQAYSPVNVFGKISGETDSLKNIGVGEIIQVMEI
jgi:hypothetical protein